MRQTPGEQATAPVGGGVKGDQGGREQGHRKPEPAQEALGLLLLALQLVARKALASTGGFEVGVSVTGDGGAGVGAGVGTAGAGDGTTGGFTGEIVSHAASSAGSSANCPS